MNLSKLDQNWSTFTASSAGQLGKYLYGFWCSLLDQGFFYLPDVVSDFAPEKLLLPRDPCPYRFLNAGFFLLPAIYRGKCQREREGDSLHLPAYTNSRGVKCLSRVSRKNMTVFYFFWVGETPPLGLPRIRYILWHSLQCMHERRLKCVMSFFWSISALAHLYSFPISFPDSKNYVDANFTLL